MKHLLFVIISLLRGYGLTLLCCVTGGGFVQLSLFLARLVVDDGGGDTLLVPLPSSTRFFRTRNRKARLVWRRRGTNPNIDVDTVLDFFKT